MLSFRGGPHGVDHGRCQHGDLGARSPPRRRDPDQRRGAPGIAGSARSGAAAPWNQDPRRAFRGARRRGLGADAPDRVLARLLCERPHGRRRRAGGYRRSCAARRRAGARRDPGEHGGTRAATSTRARVRSGCAGRRAAAACSCATTGSQELLAPWPGYGSVSEPERALEFEPRSDAACLDHGFPVPLRNVWALASLEVLTTAGWDWINERAASLAERLAERLVRTGSRGRSAWASTLVSWRDRHGDAASAVARLAAKGSSSAASRDGGSSEPR